MNEYLPLSLAIEKTGQPAEAVLAEVRDRAMRTRQGAELEIHAEDLQVWVEMIAFNATFDRTSDFARADEAADAAGRDFAGDPAPARNTGRRSPGNGGRRSVGANTRPDRRQPLPEQIAT